MIDIKTFKPYATLAYKNKYEYIVKIYDKTSCELAGWLHVNNWKLKSNSGGAWWNELYDNSNFEYSEEEYNKSVEMALIIAKAQIEKLEKEGTL